MSSFSHGCRWHVRIVPHSEKSFNCQQNSGKSSFQIVDCTNASRLEYICLSSDVTKGTNFPGNALQLDFLLISNLRPIHYSVHPYIARMHRMMNKSGDEPADCRSYYLLQSQGSSALTARVVHNDHTLLSQREDTNLIQLDNRKRRGQMNSSGSCLLVASQVIYYHQDLCSSAISSDVCPRKTPAASHEHGSITAARTLGGLRDPPMAEWPLMDVFLIECLPNVNYTFVYRCEPPFRISRSFHFCCCCCAAGDIAYECSDQQLQTRCQKEGCGCLTPAIRPMTAERCAPLAARSPRKLNGICIKDSHYARQTRERSHCLQETQVPRSWSLFKQLFHSTRSFRTILRNKFTQIPDGITLKVY